MALSDSSVERKRGSPVHLHIRDPGRGLARAGVKKLTYGYISEFCPYWVKSYVCITSIESDCAPPHLSFDYLIRFRYTEVLGGMMASTSYILLWVAVSR